MSPALLCNHTWIWGNNNIENIPLYEQSTSKVKLNFDIYKYIYTPRNNVFKIDVIVSNLVKWQFSFVLAVLGVVNTF